MYSYAGATIPHLKLMRQNCGDNVQIKAAGGVRMLHESIGVKALGVTRVGATATVAMLEEAKKRSIGNDEREIEVKGLDGEEKRAWGLLGAYYIYLENCLVET